MVRVEKRKGLKRSKQQAEEEKGENDLPLERKVDKDAIKQKIQSQNYDLSLHFTRKNPIDMDGQQKAKSFTIAWTMSVKDKKKSKFDILVSLP